MLIERKPIDKSAILRGLRGMAGLDQRQAAKLAGLGLRTITNAESGACSSKVWGKLIALYATTGIKLALLPGHNGEPVPIIAFDSDIAPDIQRASAKP